MKIICETTKRHGQGGKQDELKQNHKGQLISKGLFGVFNSSKKRQTKNQERLNYFCSLFGRIVDTKKYY